MTNAIGEGNGGYPQNGIKKESVCGFHPRSLQLPQNKDEWIGWLESNIPVGSIPHIRIVFKCGLIFDTNILPGIYVTYLGNNLTLDDIDTGYLIGYSI